VKIRQAVPSTKRHYGRIFNPNCCCHGCRTYSEAVPTPADDKARRTSLLKASRVSGSPFANRNRGLVAVPRSARNGRIAARGQHSQPVHPMKICTPLRRGSVLDALIVTAGLFWLSTAMSPWLKCAPALYPLREGTQISPDLRNPK